MKMLRCVAERRPRVECDSLQAHAAAEVQVAQLGDRESRYRHLHVCIVTRLELPAVAAGYGNEDTGYIEQYAALELCQVDVRIAIYRNLGPAGPVVDGDDQIVGRTSLPAEYGKPPCCAIDFCADCAILA